MKRWSAYFKKFLNPCRDHSGATAIEVGLTMLPFLLAIFGVMEFGWYYLKQHTTNAAVSQGIRIGAIGATFNDADGNPMSREDSIKKAILDKTDGVVDINSADIKIFPVDVDFTDPDDPAVANGSNAGGAGAFMRVRVTHTHEFFTGLIGQFFSGNNIQIVSEGTYRNEDFL